MVLLTHIETADYSNVSLSKKITHADIDIGTAAYLYVLRATPSVPRQTTDMVSVYICPIVRMPVCKTPSRFIVRIHEIIPPWYRAIAANIRRYRLLQMQNRLVSFRQYGRNNIAKFFFVAAFFARFKTGGQKSFFKV